MIKITTYNLSQEVSTTFQNPFVIIFTLIWCSIIIITLILKRNKIKANFCTLINDAKVNRHKLRLIKNARTEQEKRKIRRFIILGYILGSALICAIFLPLRLHSFYPSGVITIITIEIIILIIVSLLSVENTLEKIDKTIKQRIKQ